MLKTEYLEKLNLQVHVAIDPEEQKVYIGTRTGKTDDNTIKILCEGMIKVLSQYYYSPKRMQEELDIIKKHIWNGVLDRYPEYDGRLIKKK